MSLRALAAASLALGALQLPCAGPIVNQGGLLGDAQDLVATTNQTNAVLKKCDAVSKARVTIQEERALGGAVALKWTEKAGGILIDVPAGKSVESLRNPADLELPATKNNSLNQYLNLVGRNLALLSTRPAMGWTFGALGSSGLNAFSAPGGYVLVTKGLLGKLENEAQLAGVLAHEIAHVAREHALHTYREIKTNQCKLSAAKIVSKKVADVSGLTASMDRALNDATLGFIDLNDVSNLDALEELSNNLVDKLTTDGYAKKDEVEADQDAIELMLRAGYDPNEFISFIGKLPEGKGRHHLPNKERQELLSAWLASRTACKGEEFCEFASSGKLAKVPLASEMAAAR